MSKADKKAAKKAAKAEKKADKKPVSPELLKSIITAATALICVAAIAITSVSITGKLLDTDLNIAKKYASTDAIADSGSSDDSSSYVEDSAPVDDTVASDDSTVTDDSAAADDSASSSTNDAPADSGTATTQKAPAASNNNASTSSAPVGNDIAKIVAYYNTAANNTKAYKGTMKLAIVQGSTCKITETSFPSAAVSIAEGLLPNNYPTKKTFTVTNGEGKGFNERKQEEENKSINKILPIDDNPKMSTLVPAGVQSASCSKVNGGYKVVFKLKPESVNSFDAKPKHHFSCMDVLDISSSDIKPFEARSMTIKYTGGTLTAVVTDKNLLSSFAVDNPMKIDGKLGWGLIEGTAKIDASWKQDIKFTY